jgi:Ribosomal protein L13
MVSNLTICVFIRIPSIFCNLQSRNLYVLTCTHCGLHLHATASIGKALVLWLITWCCQQCLFDMHPQSLINQVHLARGKRYASYSPSMDMGGYVIVINAEQVVVSGNKFMDKYYFSHPTARPGHFTKEFFRELQQVRNLTVFPN